MFKNKMRYYSYKEIRDCVAYVTENCLEYKHILEAPSKILIIEQLNVFENLLLEAIKPIKGREQGIYIIVCTSMVWQVVRDILNISERDNLLKQHNAPKIYQDIIERANEIFDMHSFIRHPTEINLIKYGWIMNREWEDFQKNLIKNIAQILYKLVMSIRLMINFEKKQ